MAVEIAFPYAECYPDLEGEFQEYVSNHQEFLSNEIVRGFLDCKEHVHLLALAVCFPTAENRRQLDDAFKNYYGSIRLMTYVSTLIQYYYIDIARKNRRYRNRMLLIYDEPAEHGNSPTLGEALLSENSPAFDLPVDCERFMDDVENVRLRQALRDLTPRQLEIIECSYAKNMNDTEIAKSLGVSQQSVSKTRAKAIGKMRHMFNMGLF